MSRNQNSVMAFAVALVLLGSGVGRAQQKQNMQNAPTQLPPARPLLRQPTFIAPSPDTAMHPFPINLPTALRLANVRGLDIALASQRLTVAVTQLQQANVLWLPTVVFGMDYYRHDGTLQDSTGNNANLSKSTLMFGAGSGFGNAAVISINDAIFAPLAARQVVHAREMDRQAAANDTLQAVTDAYFRVQQARGELAGAIDATSRTRELVRRIDKLSESLVPQLEIVRARAELARRQQAELLARERWRVASADLLRVLHLGAAAQVEPLEPPQLTVRLIDPNAPLEQLLETALLNRPELAAQKDLIEAALVRLKQEKCRPLIPSLVVRGASTNPAGTLGAGVFGGGTNASLGGYAGRFDLDVQLLWQLDNLGFGNCARIDQRRAESQLAQVEFLRIQDRVAAEVSQALAQVQLASQRVGLAEQGVRLAVESAEKNLEGMRQTKRAGELILLVVRPQEAVASVQALSLAYSDYYGAVADTNRAQFRLYRALGRPAQDLLTEVKGVPPCLVPPTQGTQAEFPATSPDSRGRR